MLKSHTPTRIGDILIERGIISRAQLLKALDYQQAKQLMADARTKDARTELGEILIELGFISRDQLKQNLARQSRLRKTRLVVSFVAPLFTMACGGGGGGGASTPPANKPTPTTSSSMVQEQKSSSAQSSTLPPQSPVSNSSSSQAVAFGEQPSQQPSSAQQSSQPQSSHQQSSAAVNGPVVLYWTAPTRRLNGEQLDITEIGGYEIRYKQRAQTQYESIKIADGFTDSHYFDYLEGEYVFEIAAYDVDGLYSDFVPINPML